MDKSASKNTQLSEPKVWFITGCSTGFGREIALAALEAGYRVVVTARRLESIDDLVQLYPQCAYPLTLDITNSQQVNAAVADALAHFGQIDILVNNAGYGYVAAIEEGEDGAVRDLFETNFFGTLALTKAVLPHMRKRCSGRVINNSSAGWIDGKSGNGVLQCVKVCVGGVNGGTGKRVGAI